MDPFNSETRALMLAPPAVPIQRTNFVHYITPNIPVNCRVYYTSPVISEPALKSPSPRGKGRRSKLRPEQEQLLAEQSTTATAALTVQNVDNSNEDSSTGKELPAPDLIFTHGRGSALDNPSIIAFTEGWARTQVILNFQDNGDLNHRAGTFRALMQAFPSGSSLGGRSMGARAAARGAIYTPARKLILFTFPLVRGLSERYEELLALGPEVHVLFVLGDYDPLCHEMHLLAIRQRMRARTWWVRMVNGDHALWYDPPTKRDALCDIAGQIAAMWNVQRDPQLTELTLDWDAKEEQPKWTSWMAMAPERPRQLTMCNIKILNPTLPGGGGDFSFNL